MALTNQERVGKAIEQLRDGLKPFVERELEAVHGKKWAEIADLGPDRAHKGDPLTDPQAVLAAIWFNWEQVFKRKLSQTERPLVRELRDIRNRWAPHEGFPTDDASRALDSAERWLKAVAAPQAPEVERQRKDLMRIRYEEDAKREVRKAATAPVEGQPLSGLKPWREVVTPHADVASGRYQQAEFAADLAQVHRGEGSDEYRKPKDFFRRTYVTEGIRRLLVGALQRLAGTGGDPRRRAADELRRRQDALDAGPLSPPVGRRHHRPPGHGADPQGSRGGSAAEGQARGVRGGGALRGGPAQDARRDGDPHDGGRHGVAARREGRLRPGGPGRQAGREPGLRRPAA